MPVKRKASENLDLAGRFFHCFTTPNFMMLDFYPNKSRVQTVIIAIWLRNESNFGTLRYPRAKLIRNTTLVAVLISYVKETTALGLLIGQ